MCPMNPQAQFCPNMVCRDRGKIGAGNITIHSPKEGRYCCESCGRTFSATKGTALYRLKKDHELFITVIKLVSHGCPAKAIRTPYAGGQGGRPRLYSWEQVALVQVIKRRVGDTLTVERHIAQGAASLVEPLLQLTQAGGCIN